MHIQFKKIKFKNFLSYGNGWTELEFNDKLNIVSAQNGSGKSAIVDAISFVLFGKPYRDIKMKSLINYINKKHLEVQIEFDIGRDRYSMLRGLGPSKFELTKNGEKVEALSSKRLNQQEIDKLLGVKYLLFKNVMCIGAISNVPFFNMSLPDRRELLETVFGLGSIADMLDEVKLRNSNNKIEMKTSTATKNGLDTVIENTTSFIAEMNEKSRKFEESQQTRIQKIVDFIKTQKAEVEKHEGNLKKCNDKIAELESQQTDIESIQTRISERQLAINSKCLTIGDIREKLTNRDKPVCPICGTDLCSEHAKEYFAKLESDIRLLESDLETLNPIQEADEAELKKQLTIQNFISEVKNRIVKEESAIEALKSTMRSSASQVKDIQSETNDFDPSEKRTQLADYEEQRTAVVNRMNDLEEKIAIDTDLVSILSDSGIKRYFFEEIVPILNIKINEYIKKFGLSLEVTFDDMLEYTIMRGAFEMEYNGLSNGEKTRVNVAMLLTFYDIAKQLSNWSSSILFIDEIFDTGIDSEGITDFMKELVGMLKGDGSLGVYLISHKLNDLNLNKIEYETMKIRKVGLFSTIV